MILGIPLRSSGPIMKAVYICSQLKIKIGCLRVRKLARNHAVCMITFYLENTYLHRHLNMEKLSCLLPRTKEQSKHQTSYKLLNLQTSWWSPACTMFWCSSRTKLVEVINQHLIRLKAPSMRRNPYALLLDSLRTWDWLCCAPREISKTIVLVKKCFNNVQ